MVLRMQLIYSLFFINYSSHDNMSYKIRSAVYLTCFIHHILFKELNKIFKIRVGKILSVRGFAGSKARGFHR